MKGDFQIMPFQLGGHRAIVIYEKQLRGVSPLVKDGLAKPPRLLKTDKDVVIIISATKDEFVKSRMEGVGGYTPNDYGIFIRVNRKSRKWRDSLLGTIAHEFNHLIRFQKMKGREKTTLLTSLVFEGLAQCFEEDVTGKLRPWSKALTKAEATKVWKKIKGKLSSDSRDLSYRLFLKRDDIEFPLWSGYAIGYLLVRKRINELGNDWSSIMGMKSEEFVGKGI